MANDQRDPASYGNKEVKEQEISGTKGGPQGTREGSGNQPQGAQRTETTNTPPDRNVFAPGEAPSEQGDRTPSPESIKAHQQGMLGGGRGQQSGSHTTNGDRTQETARRE